MVPYIAVPGDCPATQWDISSKPTKIMCGVVFEKNIRIVFDTGRPNKSSHPLIRKLDHHHPERTRQFKNSPGW